jgi:flagellar protein FliS
MVTNNPYKKYQSNSVNTASPGELTLMLYNGGIKFISQAKKDLEIKNTTGKNKNIQKAQNVINELMVTLNMDYEVSKNMMALYEYMKRRLVEANLNNDVSILNEVEGYLVEFRETWKQVIQINRQNQFGQSGHI